MCSLLPPQFLAPRLYLSNRPLLTINTLTTLQPNTPNNQTPQPSTTHHHQLHQLRKFHASHRLSAASDPDPTVDLYATLEIPPTATQADIKKAYFHLSKTHHPDRNRTGSSQRFVAISDAYAVLGDAGKRAKYDRARAPAAQASSGGGSRREGQSGPGGRAASGLSKRRSHFRGPPPSFYRSGGWGAQGTKRESAGGTEGRRSHDEWERGQREKQERERAQQQGQYDYAAGYSAGYSAGSGRDGWTFAGEDDVRNAHFERDSHYKSTMSVEEQLRKGRRKRRSKLFEEAENVLEGSPGQALGQLILITGVLATGLGGSVLMYRQWGGMLGS